MWEWRGLCEQGALTTGCWQVRQYRKLLLEKCLGALREPDNASITSEGMDALAKILGQLHEGDLGAFFRTISEHCRVFFNNVRPTSSLLRLQPLGGPHMLLKRATASDSHKRKDGGGRWSRKEHKSVTYQKALIKRLLSKEVLVPKNEPSFLLLLLLIFHLFYLMI